MDVVIALEVDELWREKVFIIHVFILSLLMLVVLWYQS